MIGGQDGRELREAEGREDGGDVGVVGEVWCWWLCEYTPYGKKRIVVVGMVLSL